MQVPASIVLVATLVIAAGAAVVSPANAQSQMSDAAYMQAAHCQGRAQGSKLDTTRIDALMHAQEAGRLNAAFDRGEEMREDARRQASHAGPIERQQIALEMNGACRAYVGAAPQVVGMNSRPGE